MLGKLIYEHKAKVTGNRVLDVEGPKIETSYTGTGNKDGIEVIDMGTYTGIATPSGAVWGEGQGVLMTKDGSEVVTWKGSGIGRMTGGGRMSWRGAIYYSTTSTGRLSSLNNVVGVFEYEVDEVGNTSAKVWEWK
jgi:hypothetical protein